MADVSLLQPATVRVFLCTYRRNHLFPRALASLIGQSFKDWVCEVHNDDPSDPVPEQLVREANDPRVRMAPHPINLGATRVFNLMYRSGAKERYVSLLEDDNWWGPEFLEEMIRAMDARPEVQVGWSNMRIWQEKDDGSWRDTGRQFWEAPREDHTPLLMYWPHPKHLEGKMLHSQGAMLVRNERIEEMLVPDDMPCNYVEPVRERQFKFPILLMRAPLANFGWTISTARSSNRLQWNQYQALLLASYLAHVRPNSDECRRILATARHAVRPDTYRFLTAGLIDCRCRYILRYSRPIDWIRYAKGFIRRPLEAFGILRAKSALPQVWTALDTATAKREQERAAANPGRPIVMANVPIPGF
jgi:glycosyltransferase involved in cell wall biosynthesis